MCKGDRLRVAQIFGIGRTSLYGYRSAITRALRRP